MTPNPLLGVVFHWQGGFAAGTFYVPYRYVKRWSWETYWLTGGVFSWIIVPWVLVAIFCAVMSAGFSYGLAAGDPIRAATLRHGTAPLWLAGGIWYFQFFFYTMGETQMGAYKFSSWTLHIASIIIFSSLWGIALHEWRGAERRTKGLLALTLALLLASTMIVGYGNYLGTAG